MAEARRSGYGYIVVSASDNRVVRHDTLLEAMVEARKLAREHGKDVFYVYRPSFSTRQSTPEAPPLVEEDM